MSENLVPQNNYPSSVELVRNVDYSNEDYPLSSASINPRRTYATKVKVIDKQVTMHSQAYQLVYIPRMCNTT